MRFFAVRTSKWHSETGVLMFVLVILNVSRAAIK